MTSQEHSQLAFHWCEFQRGQRRGLETKFQSLQRMLHSVDEIFLHPG